MILLIIQSYYGEKCGHYYHECQLLHKLELVQNWSVRRSCILLPFLCGNGISEKNRKELYIYTAIADDYTELDETGNFMRKSIDIDNI